MISSLSPQRLKVIQISLLILIAIIFRLPVFFLSHYNNDELIHISLAKKIDEYGVSVFKKQQYNLFYIERGFNPRSQLIGVLEGEKKIGSLLEGFLGERGILSHHPPATPFAIALSHKIFAGRLNFLVNYSSNVYLMIRNSRFQFYVCLVPFIFSMLLVLLVYLLGSLFFSHKVGLISSLFFSLSPIELLTANKLWADDMTAFFVVLSVVLYLYSFKSDKPIFSLFAGASCGAAILTKMSAVYIVFTVLLFHLFENRNKTASFQNIKDFLFDKKILYFLSAVFIVSAWWFNLYYSNFDPHAIKGYFKVVETGEAVRNWNRYFSVVSDRPWYSYFVLVPYQFPLYLLSYVLIPLFVFRRKIQSFGDFINDEYRYIQFLLLWTAATFVFLSLKPGKELRYMLIAYPAIAVLSAYCLNLFFEWLKSKNFDVNLNLIKLFFVSTIFLSLFYSLKIALPRVLLRADIIPIPL